MTLSPLARELREVAKRGLLDDVPSLLECKGLLSLTTVQAQTGADVGPLDRARSVSALLQGIFEELLEPGPEESEAQRRVRERRRELIHGLFQLDEQWKGIGLTPRRERLSGEGLGSDTKRFREREEEPLYELIALLLQAGEDAAADAEAKIRAAAHALAFGTNPMPRSGSPHGRGIRYREYPDGYRIKGEARPSFNNYLDLPDGSPRDERSFAGARIAGSPGFPRGGFETIAPLAVSPGDRVSISIYLHNNAGLDGNVRDAQGVARNVRVYVNFPTGQAGEGLALASYIRSDNAIVDERQAAIKTISDNTSIVSLSGRSIRLEYLSGSGRVLQRRAGGGAQSPDDAKGDARYQIWNLTPAQEYWLFTGRLRNVGGNSEEIRTLGLPVGSDGSGDPLAAVGVDQKRGLTFLGGPEYEARVQFQVNVEDG